jgi:hypothetical protein
MSTWQHVTVRCPRCASDVSVRVADGVHITRVPHVREQILARTFHTFTCASCSSMFPVTKRLVYTDFDRDHWILVGLAGDEATWPASEAQLNKDITMAFDHGSPLVHWIANRIRSRVVFGYEALREKLVIWDAGIEDGVIECMKLRAIATDPTLGAAGSQLVVDRIGDDGSIHFIWRERAAAAFVRELAVPASWLAETDRDHASLVARFAELFGSGYVSFRRLARGRIE